MAYGMVLYAAIMQILYIVSYQAINHAIRLIY